jgi:phosphate transport system protein
MPKLRRHFRDRLATLEDDVLGMGQRVLDMLSDVMAALDDRDVARADQVIRADDRVDEIFRGVQAEVLTTLALEAPVASELRVVNALIHVNLHLERVGDLCVNTALFVRQVEHLLDDPGLMAQFQEMGQHAGRVVASSLESFARRDADAARAVAVLDDPIDRLNKGLFRRLVKLAAADEERLDWAMRMVLVARYLERIGDHGVDIAEQTIFVVTGETVELASNSPP